MSDLKSVDKRSLQNKMPQYLKERLHSPGEVQSAVHTGAVDLVSLGYVDHVRSDKLTMDVRLYGKKGYLTNVPISFPYAGPMGIIGSMPEEGSNVILVRAQGTSNYSVSSYYPIAYLPAMITEAPDYVSVKKYPDAVGSKDKNVFFTKFRELRNGDKIIGSGQGSEIFLDGDIELHDSSGSELFLRAGDQALISTTLSNFMFSDGVWRSAGLAQRNSLKTKDRDDLPIFGLNAESAIMQDGKRVVYIRPESDQLTYGGRIYSEYRVEVDEYGNRYLPGNDINGVINSTIRDPVCIVSMGNFIGNDSVDPHTYGHLLGVRLFDDPESDFGRFNLVPMSLSGGVDYPATLGMAYALYTPKTDAFIGIDKEGHYYQYFPASTSINPLGAGRSMSVLAHGSKKEIYGSDSGGNSWDLTLRGGLKWRLGKHTDKNNFFSMDIRTSGPAYFEFGVPENASLEDIASPQPQRLESLSGYGKIERIVGNLRTDIEGTRETRIEGSDILSINGLQEFSFTSVRETIGSVKTVNVGDNYSVTVLKERNEKFGNRVTTILTGSDELTVLKGNVTKNITTIGNFETSTRVGNITEQISVKGNRTFTSTAGDYKVSCGAGNVEVSTRVGKISVETRSGTVKISGPMGVDINSTGKIKINGGTVDIGRGAVKGGVITTRSHLDYTTGSPLIGSFTVKSAG